MKKQFAIPFLILGLALSGCKSSTNQDLRVQPTESPEVCAFNMESRGYINVGK